MPRYRKGSLEAKLYQGFKQAAKGDTPEKEAHFYRAEDGTVKRWKPAERSNSARSRAHRLDAGLPPLRDVQAGLGYFPDEMLSLIIQGMAVLARNYPHTADEAASLTAECWKQQAKRKGL